MSVHAWCSKGDGITYKGGDLWCVVVIGWLAVRVAHRVIVVLTVRASCAKKTTRKTVAVHASPAHAAAVKNVTVECRVPVVPAVKSRGNAHAYTNSSRA